ncbi:YkgJ family cysteine cluster protein [Dehalobacterium formicoaceticum]|uniref:YkgJ family cysteine cluster protein n=1 Tax=Dehalobacterium formicoaceticum TaxID=51515 RepID=A0ABT1Y418_9FIRM|nr:YkgJ family cysteine cluster protein [Dehalobacterium formicoaceticum]MCR6545608.1 YkgJ family cysteine cluster protein [Dehalobacterium formicoaceticum]
MNINVFLAQFDDAFGYDLEILDENATIQDYLNALNQFQEKYVENCKGCDGCCYERIPLTSIDILTYLKDPTLPLTPFIHQYCKVTGTGPVLDICLKRNPDQSCIFLDREQKICRRHPARSFVCQSFVCLPHSEEAGQLRDLILNVGEDDLVHRYLNEAKEKGTAPVIHENNEAAPSLIDYPATIFTGKRNYDEIRIKDVLPENLWQKLYIHPRL